MINSKLVSFVPVVLAVALSACGGGSPKDETATAYCPVPLTVQDAERLTRFKNGPGRDPRDVAFEAALAGASATCNLGHSTMNIDLAMRVAVNAGPSVSPGVSSVPYFVRVIDGRGAGRADRWERHADARGG